jgi:hypothetical protein
MLLLDMLFMRSAHVRQLLVGSLAELMTLTVGSNRARPLPAPAEGAGRLRQLALTSLERWTKEFAHCYPQLATAMSFASDTLRLELPSVAQQRAADEKRRREQQTQLLLQAKYEQVRTSCDSVLAELELVLVEIDECVGMLVPDVDDANADSGAIVAAFSVSANDNDDDEDDNIDDADVVTSFDRLVNGPTSDRSALIAHSAPPSTSATASRSAPSTGVISSRLAMPPTLYAFAPPTARPVVPSNSAHKHTESAHSATLNALSTARLVASLAEGAATRTAKRSRNADDAAAGEVSVSVDVLSSTSTSTTPARVLVRESDDNAVLFGALRERVPALLRWLLGPAIAWEAVLSRVHADGVRVVQADRDELLRRVVQCKHRARQ